MKDIKSYDGLISFLVIGRSIFYSFFYMNT